MIRHLMTLACLMALATPALGQDWDDDFDRRFGPAAGDFSLQISGVGSNDRDFDIGQFGANIELGYFITNALEVSLRQQINFADSGVGSSNVNASTRGAIDYHFDLGRFQPFVGGNLGYVYGDNVRDTWAAGPEVGLKFYAREKTYLFARVEYQFFFRGGGELDEQFRNGQFVYNVGIGFNF